ncbi:MAG: tRNA pseudouridine(55) synthase TruB [Treponema sp.]|jgi:tRNA pseudouridine55 synthase|nr:tRNA pseudouridine(55) synthase TruB [Treponema sp.]
MADSGLILLNKKPGTTSFDALREIKRAFGTGKVGHTGTLDKFAQGLLLVLAGKALRLAQWFTHCDKQYTGRIYFGIETDTLDPEGVPVARSEVPSRQRVEQAIAAFNGPVMQAPPAYSAVHINGKRASALARSGKMPEMAERSVFIYKLELVNWEPPYADIRVYCSSGTYIRSLARDIAAAAGSSAHLCSLVRTHVAGFSLKDQNTENNGFFLQKIDKNVISSLGMPWYEISGEEYEKIKHGKPPQPVLQEKYLFPAVYTPPINNKEKSSCIKTAAVFYGESLAAVVVNAEGRWKYGCVI